MEFVATEGITYLGPDGEEKRVEPGQTVSDLPERSVGWLFAGGHVIHPPVVPDTVKAAVGELEPQEQEPDALTDAPDEDSPESESEPSPDEPSPDEPSPDEPDPEAEEG
jgi:hypothetical protein